MKTHPYSRRQRFLFWLIFEDQRDITKKKQAKKLLEESRELIKEGNIIYSAITGFESGNNTPIIIDTKERLETNIEYISEDIKRIYKRLAFHKRDFYYTLPLG